MIALVSIHGAYSAELTFRAAFKAGNSVEVSRKCYISTSLRSVLPHQICSFRVVEVVEGEAVTEHHIIPRVQIDAGKIFGFFDEEVSSPPLVFLLSSLIQLTKLLFGMYVFFLVSMLPFLSFCPSQKPNYTGHN